MSVVLQRVKDEGRFDRRVSRRAFLVVVPYGEYAHVWKVSTVEQARSCPLDERATIGAQAYGAAPAIHNARAFAVVFGWLVAVR